MWVSVLHKKVRWSDSALSKGVPHNKHFRTSPETVWQSRKQQQNHQAMAFVSRTESLPGASGRKSPLPYPDKPFFSWGVMHQPSLYNLSKGNNTMLFKHQNKPCQTPELEIPLRKAQTEETEGKTLAPITAV